jgi:hypothetical protein
MRRLTVWLGLVVLAAALAVGATAAIAGQHTDPVTAVVAGLRVTVHETTCAGDDGQYRQRLESFAGSAGGDPRLNGIATGYLASLTNTTTGRGTMAGALVVTDPQSHQVRWRAALQGVATGSGGSTVKGLLTGFVNDFGTQQGGRLIANFEASFNGASLYLGIGFPGSNAEPAVIQGGHCQLSSGDRPGK